MAGEDAQTGSQPESESGRLAIGPSGAQSSKLECDGDAFDSLGRGEATEVF